MGLLSPMSLTSSFCLESPENAGYPEVYDQGSSAAYQGYSTNSDGWVVTEALIISK